MQTIDSSLTTHYLDNFDENEIHALGDTFSRDGFIKIPNIVPIKCKEQVHREIYTLLDEHSERRDLTLKTTDNTPRHLSVVRSEKIEAYNGLIQQLSTTKTLTTLLSRIAKETLLNDVKSDERFVITKQEYKGDTHGWHWGDYAFALIWIVQTPPIADGGMLQCVPHTHWNKNNAQINQYICDNPIKTHALYSGDVYFLKADTTLHRTVPLSKNSLRIMLNMTFACEADVNKHALSVDDRWWDNQAATAISHVN